MMVKNGLELEYFEIPPCGSHFLLFHFTSWKGGLFFKITNLEAKVTFFEHGGSSKKIFVVYVLMADETLSQKI